MPAKSAELDGWSLFNSDVLKVLKHVSGLNKEQEWSELLNFVVIFLNFKKKMLK